jgi:hypothetical protein
MKSVGFAAILCSLSVVPLAAEEPPAPVETFYQQVDIQRYPRFSVQGVNISQQIHYQILSSFDVYPPDERGNRKAVQTVSNATLIEADPLSQAVFTQSLAAMQGRKFTFKVDKYSEVVLIDGHQDNSKAVEVQRPESKTLLVSTVIDEDGWKELAQLTLFQPPQTGRSRRSFVRKTTHDWGSLGSWYGKTDFTSRSAGRNKKRFSYQHQLEYIAPDKQAPKQTDSFPFQIDNAKFRVYEARGQIDYDEKYKRVTTVREVFHARGTIGTTVAGIPSTIEIDEKQIFTITVTGQRLLKVDPSSQSTSGSRGEK